MGFKVFDYECSCGEFCGDLLVEDEEKPECPVCSKLMKRLFPAPRSPERQGRFQPFWSDTLQVRIKDREDLGKLRNYAKSKGLTNVGHMHQRPDRKAIKHNYEND